MRHIVFTALLFITAAPLFSQEDCDVFNIQDLAAEVLTQQATIEALSCYSGVEMDGYRYYGVPIGDQCWFAENLRTTVYADGWPIPEFTSSSVWNGLDYGARCAYDNDYVANYQYGMLYNWYAVNNARGLCPSGWHVPTDGEWTELENYISSQGFSGTEGKALRAKAAWNGVGFSGGGTDDFGFSALPGGLRILTFDPGYAGHGLDGYWWSSSPNGGNPWGRYLVPSYDSPDRVNLNPRWGCSVRCLRGNANLGCMDPSYIEFDATANTDDGSCATLVVNGCMDPAYVEYDATANTDDGTCATPIDPNCVDVVMDGHTYSVIQIGGQCWFAENLRTTVYADGSAIPEETDNSSWGSLSTDARCDYDNNADNVATYGRLYNWYAASDAAGLCPSGWHVPTDGEWTELENYISSQGFSGTEGTALKSTSGWNSGANGTDHFGFSALPGGYRNSAGPFYLDGSYGLWWSSSLNGDKARYRQLKDSPDFGQLNGNLRAGLSVRCLRDDD